MEKSSIKKINTAGLIGYILSIILIIVSIAGMVGIAILTVGAITVSNDNINVKVSTNIDINSTGNFLSKLNYFIGLNEIKDLDTLTESAKDGIKLNDSDLEELHVEEKDGGLVINAKTNDITISMKKIIVALVATFIFLGSVTVALYMLKALMKSLKKCETPFSQEIVNNMTRFATSLILVIVIKALASGFWSSVKSGLSYNLSIDLGNVLLVAIIYILILVFKYGAGLQVESDETL